MIRACKSVSNPSSRDLSWRHLLLAAVLFTTTHCALAEKVTVYKKVLPDGSISYSDSPDKDAKALEVEPVPTVPALQSRTPISLERFEETEVKPPYETFELISPASDSAFWSGDGTVPVEIKLVPGLLPGHRLEVLIDGNLIGAAQSTSYKVPNVDRGTHVLTARIMNSVDRVVVTKKATFTIHRPIAR